MFILNFDTLHKHGMAGNSLTKLRTKSLSMSKSCAEIKCWKFYTGKDKTRDNEYNYTSFCLIKLHKFTKWLHNLLVRVEC